MTVIFKGGPYLVVRSRDGRNFELCEDKDIISSTGEVYRMPVGGQSDGASIPQSFWSTGLAPFGEYWPAAYAHDLAYRGTLLRQLEDGSFVKAMLSKEQSDLLLLDLMTALVVELATKEMIYEGVVKFGWKAFTDDRKG